MKPSIIVSLSCYTFRTFHPALYQLAATHTFDWIKVYIFYDPNVFVTLLLLQYSLVKSYNYDFYRNDAPRWSVLSQFVISSLMISICDELRLMLRKKNDFSWKNILLPQTAGRIKLLDQQTKSLFKLVNDNKFAVKRQNSIHYSMKFLEGAHSVLKRVTLCDHIIGNNQRINYSINSPSLAVKCAIPVRFQTFII